jgi:hypothetical protein
MNAQVKNSTDTARPCVASVLPVVVIAALAGALALHAIVYGPAIRERADRLQAEQIAEENRSLCNKLGMGNGSERFTACAEVLSEVRRQEARRVYTEVAGIL